MSNKYPCIYYDNGKCQKFSDDTYNAWCSFSDCESRTPSNGDKIRAMSDEELAKWLADAWDCHECSEHERIGDHPLLRSEPCDQECERHCLDWLKRRAEEDT